jgi:hypothetical protein
MVHGDVQQMWLWYLLLSTGGTKVGEVCLVPVPIWGILKFTSNNQTSYLREVQRARHLLVFSKYCQKRHYSLCR